MLRNLLAERFHLKLHVEPREFAAYELVVSKKGPKLKEAGADPGGSPGGALASRYRTQGWPELPPNRPAMAMSHSLVGGSVLIRLRAQQKPISELAGFLRPPDDVGLFRPFKSVLQLALHARRKAGDSAR